MSVPSVWSERPTPLGATPEESTEVDVVVVGAGIAGLATATMLGELGRRVALVSRHEVDATVTGRSNAKVTALHQLVYADLEDRHGTTGATNYADATTRAISWLRRRAVEVMEPAAAMTVARNDEEHRRLLEEEAAANRAGLDVTLVDRPEQWPGALSGLRLDGQAQVDPVALSSHLLDSLPATVSSHTGTVTGISRTQGGVRVRGEGWQINRPARGGGDRVADPGPRWLVRGLRGTDVLPGRAGARSHGDRRGPRHDDQCRGADPVGQIGCRRWQAGHPDRRRGSPDRQNRRGQTMAWTSWRTGGGATFTDSANGWPRGVPRTS